MVLGLEQWSPNFLSRTPGLGFVGIVLGLISKWSLIKVGGI